MTEKVRPSRAADQAPADKQDENKITFMETVGLAVIFARQHEGGKQGLFASVQTVPLGGKTMIVYTQAPPPEETIALLHCCQALQNQLSNSHKNTKNRLFLSK